MFDIDPIIAQKRVETRGEDLSRFDAESLDFHKTLRSAFLEIAKGDAERIAVIEADESPQAVHTRILHAVTKKYPELAGRLASVTA